MTNARFGPRSGDDIVTLVDENVLGWVVLRDELGPFATAAPLRPVLIDGGVEKLVGHVPRARRVSRCLETPCEALILIVGPNRYISPSWLTDRSQAPTWNFTMVQFLTEARLVNDPLFLESHLRNLTIATERGRTRAWHIDEMGSRLHTLAKRIVGFEARIVATDSRFKLGQDEDDETYVEIVRALECAGSQDLLAWMRRYNPGRA